MERWLVTGASGLVGAAVCERAARLGVEVIRTSGSGRDHTHPVDLGRRGAMTSLLDAFQPDRVLHLGGVALPAEVARDLETARRVNVSGSSEIVKWCARNRRWLLFTSTDQVFDGEAGPYSESDPTRPVTQYGSMKSEVESLVIPAGGLVARLGWVLNDTSTGRPDFVRTALSQLREGQIVHAVADEHRTPLQLSAAAEILCRLAAASHTGLVHVAGAEHVTPYSLVRREALRAGLAASLIRPATRRNLAPAGRPRDLRLSTARLGRLSFRTDPLAEAS